MIEETLRAARRRIGSTVGKYRLVAVLGVGGMATVHAAVHRNGHRVAIKTLVTELARDDELRARFVREAYTANAIDHPGVVRVVDDDVDDDGCPYLVMELLEGETLRERWAEASRTMPAAEVVAFAKQVLSVLEAAHAVGVVHRDIKPDNLFVTTEGVLKVLDFGIARAPTAHADATQTGRAMGTPAFMPPEQALAHADEIDARTDVWAVAATMYTLLTGSFVHETSNTAELVVAAATRPAPSLAKKRPDLDIPLIAVVDRGLAFAREERWPSARAMLDALGAIADPVSMPRGRNRLALASSPTLDVSSSPDEATVSDEELQASFQPTRASAGLVAPRRAPRSPLIAGLPRPHPTPVPIVVATLRSGPGDAPSEPEVPTEVATTGPTDAPPPPAPGPAPARLRPLGWSLLAAFALLCGGFVWFGATRTVPAPAPSASSAPAPACASDLACTASLAEPGVCRAGTCIRLASIDCAVRAEPSDLADPETIWIGAMFSSEGSLRAVDLARRDIHEVASGLPPVRPGGPRRPIGVIACDDRADPVRVARHLVDDVRVPAVLGFSLSKEALDLTNAVFQPRGVLALAGNQSTMLSNVPRPPGDARMLFRVSPSARQFAEAMMAVVNDHWEPELRGAGPLRLALARVPNTTGVSYADVFLSEMKLGGVAVAADHARFRQIVTPLDGDPDHGARARTTAELVELRPHVIVATGGGAWLVEAVEQAWPADATFRPRWVELGMLADGHAAVVASRPDLRERILGVDASTAHPAFAKYAVRYREAHGVTPPIDVPAFAYDAFYLFAYLAAAIGERPLAGPELAAALPRLRTGTPIDVGRGGIFAVFDALARGASVDLVGTTTSLDVDLDSGDSPTRMAAYCLTSAAADRLPRPIESGLFVSPATRHVEGKKACP